MPPPALLAAVVLFQRVVAGVVRLIAAVVVDVAVELRKLPPTGLVIRKVRLSSCLSLPRSRLPGQLSRPLPPPKLLLPI